MHMRRKRETLALGKRIIHQMNEWWTDSSYLIYLTKFLNAERNMLYTISLSFHSKYFSKYFTERIIPLYQLATVVIVRTWSMVSLAFKVGWMKIMQSYGKFCADRGADYEYVCRKSQKVVEIVINKFFKQFLKN